MTYLLLATDPMGNTWSLDVDTFDKGASFFVPILDRKNGMIDLKKKFKSLGMNVFVKPTVEEDVLGCRVWRL